MQSGSSYIHLKLLIKELLILKVFITFFMTTFPIVLAWLLLYTKLFLKNTGTGTKLTSELCGKFLQCFGTVFIIMRIRVHTSLLFSPFE